LSEPTEIKNVRIIHLPKLSVTSNTLPALTILPSNPVSSLTSLRTASSAASLSNKSRNRLPFIWGKMSLWVSFQK
jgi:hypothetical protein